MKIFKKIMLCFLFVFSFFSVFLLTACDSKDDGICKEHVFTSSIIKSETCNKNGKKLFSCKYCDYSYEEEIYSSGHDYKVTKEVLPTCVKDGYTEFTCKDCFNVYTEKVVKLQHNYILTVSRQATCTTNGYEIYDCENCSSSYKTELQATGHNLSLIDFKVSFTL